MSYNEVRRRHDELTATFMGKILSSGPYESAGYFFGSADAIAAQNLGASAYAGAVVLVLSWLLLAFKENRPHERQRLGRVEQERAPR
jgi:hypothetical protein